MRHVTLGVLVTASLVSSCSNDPNPPGTGTGTGTLTLTPSDTVQVTGPTTFVAAPTPSNARVTWKLEGVGTLSSTTGTEVVYSPPAAPSPGTTATLTASAGASSASASLVLGPADNTLSPAQIPGLEAAVIVRYDAHDIPGIKCATIADCLTVQGYIHARDRLFPMDLLRHLARGKVAELIGPLGLSQDVQLRTLFTTRDGRRLEDALVASMDANSAALVGAYVNGVNAYLAELRAGSGALPGEYAQLPYPITANDIADWTPADTLAIARLQQFQLSESLSEELDYATFASVYAGTSPGKMDVWIRAAAPPSEQTHTLAPGGATASLRRRAPRRRPFDLAPWREALGDARRELAGLFRTLEPLDEAVGSNNWVVDATHSENGHAMVANDPHLELQYPPLFHLASMTSSNPADGLDLTGGAFPGIPGALVGRGAHVGWGVTVVGYDVTDLYLEQIVPTCAGAPANVPCVVFHGGAVPTLPVPQTYMVRVGAGSAGLVDAKTAITGFTNDIVLVIPHHGPVVKAPDAGGHAVSFRWTGHETDTQDLKAILGLNTAASVDDAFSALTYFATGAQNFVLADDQGNIGYDPHALVPVRRFADVRVTPAASLLPPWFPLPGDGTAEWGTGNAADDCAGSGTSRPARACWLADSELPQGKNPAKGYFATANADPTYPSVSDDNQPLAHPPYLSFNWSDSTGFRHARITHQLDALTSSGGKVSEAEMEALQGDHVSRMGALYASYIAALPAGSADFEAARQVLAQWTGSGNDCPSGLLDGNPQSTAIDTPRLPASAGCMLFHAFARTLHRNVFADDFAFVQARTKTTLSVSGDESVKGMIYMLQNPTTADQSFCNDVDSTGNQTATHDCASQVVAALEQAYRSLLSGVGATSTWIWGRAHTMQPVSQLPLVTTGYRPGPFARPGGSYTVDVGNPSLGATGLSFPYTSGSNVRHVSVMDPSHAVVRMQLPGPERDVPTDTPGSLDLLEQYVLNQYFDFAHGSQLDSVAREVQVFTPSHAP